MEEKLQSILDRYQVISEELNNPDITNDQKKFKKLSIEFKNLSTIEKVASEYLKVLSEIKQNKELLKDKSTEAELKDMIYEDLEVLGNRKEELDEELKILLIPKDPNDTKNCILEIRAGTGGDEAGIFAGDLLRMYQKYADIAGLNISIISVNHADKGGFKEIVLEVSGEEIYGKLKFESGVHRVQRVPETESQGRLHTSAASVVVMPEADDVEIELLDKDIKKDTFRASGAGGQHVNKTDSAVRLTHLPTGVVVECQEERSQIKNYEKALKVLKTRIYERELKKQMEEIASKRKTIVSTGDRSAKIRTYNYPQNRVTDHRLEGDAKNYSLREIIEGSLENLIENLQIAERTEILKAGQQ